MKQLDPACQKFVPKVQALFEYGKEQHERTMRVEAKREAAAAKAAAQTKADAQAKTPPQE